MMPNRPTLVRGLPCPVQCVETGKTYPSITAAARAAGVSLHQLRQAIADGEHWQLLPHEQTGWSADHPWRRPSSKSKRR